LQGLYFHVPSAKEAKAVFVLLFQNVFQFTLDCLAAT